MIRYRVANGGSLHGRLKPAGDKSISHRALLLAAIAEGETTVEGFLASADTRATQQALETMGVSFVTQGNLTVTVAGVGLRGLQAPASAIELGNSGTSMRLLPGVLVSQGFTVRLTGDASLHRRPMRRIVEPLTQMGARITCSDAGTAPLLISPADKLVGMRYQPAVASAQVKSCLLLAGLYAEGETTVIEPVATRDHTERMLAEFGCDVNRHGTAVTLRSGVSLRGTRIRVPADISSAAFFMVGAAISEGSDLVLEHVGMNPTRTGIIDILRQMGADLTIHNESVVGREPTADIRVRGAPLHGIDIAPALVPRAIDEFPAILVAAACARGTTRLSGATELRHKESDRIAGVAAGLTALGIDCEATRDGMLVDGGQISGGIVDSGGDHRVAMAFAVAALRAQRTVEIQDCAAVATSFPGFVGAARSTGLDIQELSA